jgi:twitching motility protein PilT
MLAVISQRLHYRPELNIRVPECEILVPTHAVKNFIRNRDFFKITSSLETGAEHGMWTLQRYRAWLESRKTWYIPGKTPESADSEPGEAPPPPANPPAFPIAPKAPKPDAKHGLSQPLGAKGHTRIEIEPGESEFGKILKRPGE